MASPVEGSNPQRLSADRLKLFQERNMVYTNGKAVSVEASGKASSQSIPTSVERAMTPPPLPPRPSNQNQNSQSLVAPAQSAMEKPALPPRPVALNQRTVERQDPNCCSRLFSCCFSKSHQD